MLGVCVAAVGFEWNACAGTFKMYILLTYVDACPMCVILFVRTLSLPMQMLSFGLVVPLGFGKEGI